MQSGRYQWLRLLAVILTGMILQASAEAQVRRSSASSSAAAMNAKLARINAAQANLTKQLKQARKKAEADSPALSSAKSDHAEAQREYVAAQKTVVENLKKTNPEFRDLAQESERLRNQIAFLGKSKSGSANLNSMKYRLKSKTRRALALEDDAFDADSTIQEIRDRLATAHSAEESALEEVKAAVAQNPAVQAAQKQLNQAMGGR